MKKILLTFATVYFILEFALIFILFGWSAFGGSKSMTFFQKIVTFLFTFPSNWLFDNNESLFLYYAIPNTIFWTLILLLLLILWEKLKKKIYS